MAFPLVSTFHIAAVRTAAGAPPAESDFSWTSYFHCPAGNVNPPVASTVQLVHVAGMAGTPALTPVFASELARLTVGTKGAQPVVFSATRLSAWGRSVPVVAVLTSVYVVVGPALLPTRMYGAVAVLAGILAR